MYGYGLYGPWFGRGWFGPWPGRGPFSYLPPWQRPGWLFGRGACWWLFNPYIQNIYSYPYSSYSLAPYPSVYPMIQPTLTKEQERQMLTEEIKAVEQELAELKKRLNELEKR